MKFNRGGRRDATRPQALATGNAGDVYLCRPFLIHPAQPEPAPAEPISLDRPDGAYSPMETAIRAGLGRGLAVQRAVPKSWVQ